MSRKYTVHAGHAAKGNLFTGAKGYVEESVVDRYIKDAVISYLRKDGCTAIDCTVDSGVSQSNIITKIKKRINSEPNAIANISIHLNACNRSSRDGKIKGVECCVYPGDKKAIELANNICRSVASLGFTNRGIKPRSDLGVLKGITNGGTNVLVECFFCNDEDDYRLYTSVGAITIGKAIAEAMVGHKINTNPATTGKFVYNNIDYSPVFNANYYAINNSDVKKDKVYGVNDASMFRHFIDFGMREGRQACADFNVQVYKERYPDLKDTYGNDLPKYYEHFCVFGFSEGRIAI